MSVKNRKAAATNKKPGWDLAELEKISSQSTVPDNKSQPIKPTRPTESQAPIASSAMDLQSQGETLQKKAVHMKSRWVPLVCLFCVAGLFLWASLAKIDQVTRGHGKVIPSSKVQTIQSLEAGIVVLSLIHI